MPPEVRRAVGDAYGIHQLPRINSRRNMVRGRVYSGDDECTATVAFIKFERFETVAGEQYLRRRAREVVHVVRHQETGCTGERVGHDGI